MSRWTLYSLSQLRPPSHFARTYFQQKWTAKAATRAYHGEQIREKKWARMFQRTAPAVVPMDHKYLAAFDGSEQAAGRGTGADATAKQRAPPMTPYMQMTFFPLERRLDLRSGGGGPLGQDGSVHGGDDLLECHDVLARASGR